MLPVGHPEGVRAYQQAASQLTTDQLTHHYTDGLTFFHDGFVPYLKQTLTQLSGGAWNLDDYVAYAAGSDVDLMTHVVEALALHQRVSLFPGDWYGFVVGVTQQQNVHWDTNSQNSLACLCIPSVRNGHVTEGMIEFLKQAESCLLNLNLYPTLSSTERKSVANSLNPVLEKSLLSISFSRGFGLTASQLGVMLVHRDHPLRAQYDSQWNWLTYFYNALAARAFMALDVDALQQTDKIRREWLHAWFEKTNLPNVESGSYYVRSFWVNETVPEILQPLVRLQEHGSSLIRLCYKPK